MIKAVIVDDEIFALRHLEQMLGSFDRIQVVGCYQQPQIALSHLKKLQPHLIISDIFMPEMDGLEFAEKAANLLPNACIAFLTAFDNFAIKAFELGAFDYILKPVTHDRLERLIQRMESEIIRCNKKNGEAAARPENQFKNFITVNHADSIMVINKSEILYCCASNKKTYIYTEAGCYESRYTLEQLEGLLEPYFFRCHRGYLVNVQYIRELAPMFNQTYLIRLRNSRAEIPVSRNYAVKIKDFLNI